MNRAISTVLIFATGAAVGSVITWQGLKTKYEQLAQDEIDSVKEMYASKPVSPIIEPDETVERAAEQAKEKPDISEYAALLRSAGYTTKSEEDMKKDMNERPYVITPDEFGERDDYMTVSLNYFVGDGYLADDNYELMENVEESVGFESLNHFGEYEDDSVFVRNDRLKVDYEILLDQRNYMDVLKTLPHHVRV